MAEKKPKASDHADPENMKHPILTQTHVTSLTRSINRAKNEDGTPYSEEKKAKIVGQAKKIAKRKGLTIPKAWGAKESVEATATLSDQMIRRALADALDLDADPDGDGDDDNIQNCGWNYCDVVDVFDDYFVYSYYEDQDKDDNGMYKRGYSLDANDQPVLGADISRVRRVVSYVTFIPAADDETTEAIVYGQLQNLVNRGGEVRVGESIAERAGTFREVLESHAITESSDDGADGFHIQGTAIMPGLNKSGNRVYPKETLSAAVPLFKGKKMYIDHPSAFDERNRPERSVMDVGAVIEEAWSNAEGGIDYRAVVIDPPLREKLSLMKQAGALNAMGTSVNYQGVGSDLMYEGKKVSNIDSIDVLYSLDFVTEPGAWGDIAHMESLAAGVVVEEEREDTVADDATIKALEAQIATLTQAVKESDERAQAEAKARRISDARLVIKGLLAESKLPDVSQARILAHYEGVESAEGAEETIKGEQEYVKSLTEGLTKKADPKNLPARRSNVVVGMGGTTARENEAEEPRNRTVDETADALADFMPGGFAGAKSFVESMR